MDFWVDLDQSVTFWPTSVRARRWLEQNFDCRAELGTSKDRALMIERALVAENFDVASRAPREHQLDFDDQYSALLIAQATRQVGKDDEALRKLADLRDNVLRSIDPRSKILLAQIDREIAAARKLARTPRPTKKPVARFHFGLITKCVRRAACDVEQTLVRLALLIVLVIELYRFITGR